MADTRRLAAHATLVALVIGGLVLAGGIALIVVLGRSGGSGHDTGDRAAGARVTTSAAPTTSASSRPAPPTATPTKSQPTKSQPTRSQPPTPKPTTPKPTRSKPTRSKPPAAKPVVYVVKPGDNLFIIAKWFHQHGYVGLYERNRKVIGDNPNLIFPGQRITISAGGRMTFLD